MRGLTILRVSGLMTYVGFIVLGCTIALGLTLGGGQGPAAIDFGDPAVLAQLARNHADFVLLTTLALVAPALALTVGIGWYYLLRDKSELAGLGVLLWYFGMIFVIWQDAAELMLVSFLPSAHGHADEANAAALLAAGGLLGQLNGAFQFVGNAISNAGIATLSAVMLAHPGRWRAMGMLGLLSAVLTVAGYVLSAPGPVRLLAFGVFQAWLLGMGWLMLSAGNGRAGEGRERPFDAAGAA